MYLRRLNMNGLSFMGDNLMFRQFSAEILLNWEKSGMSAYVVILCILMLVFVDSSASLKYAGSWIPRST
jgi:hypothetical protein